MKPAFFKTPDHFRKWFEKNHKKKEELWVGFYKKATGKPSITWPESVDQALCYGWIDGIRKSIDDSSYKIRFTPRKPSSHWSRVNIEKVKELKKQKLMMPAGMAAFEKMRKDNAENASYEQKKVELSPAFEKLFRENKAAWDFFHKMAPSYRKQAIWWIMSAKRIETQRRRLSILVEDSKNKRKIKPLRRGY